LSLIPVVISFSANFCWASERTITSESSQHFLFTDGFMTLPSKNLFGEINLCLFQTQMDVWKWLRGGTWRRTTFNPFEPPGLKVMREWMHVLQELKCLLTNLSIFSEN
jgi:hypothetical protein